MENLLRDGDYVPDGFGGFVRLQGQEALLQRALFKMNVRRGSFPFLPQMGSRFHDLGKEKPETRNLAARQYAAEALSGMGLRVREASVTPISDDHARVDVRMELAGGSALVEVQV